MCSFSLYPEWTAFRCFARQTPQERTKLLPETCKAAFPAGKILSEICTVRLASVAGRRHVGGYILSAFVVTSRLSSALHRLSLLSGWRIVIHNVIEKILLRTAGDTKLEIGKAQVDKVFQELEDLLSCGWKYRCVGILVKCTHDYINRRPPWKSEDPPRAFHKSMIIRLLGRYLEYSPQRTS